MRSKPCLDSADKGTYALLLRLPQDDWLTIGRLGRFLLPRGFYAYVGSAFGPGGLRSRLRHHLRPVRRPHWHLDYLRQVAQPVEIWGAPVRREHDWAAEFGEWPETGVPAPRFGASDCQCVSHLFHYRQRPDLPALRARLQQQYPDDEPITLVWPEDRRCSTGAVFLSS